MPTCLEYIQDLEPTGVRGILGGTKGKVGGEETPGVTLKQINGPGEFLVVRPVLSFNTATQASRKPYVICRLEISLHLQNFI